MLKRTKTETPAGGTRALSMEGRKMSENTVSPAVAITVSEEAIDLVSGSLAPRNSVGEASVAFYRAALEAAGKDPESLTFDEVVEVTRRLYGPSADYRREQADVAKAAKEQERAAAKAKRDAEKKARLAAEAERLRAKLAALES